MEIYLDNSATTKVCHNAAMEMMQVLTCEYGNPSSLHKKGVEASLALDKARSRIAKALSCKSEEIYFTNSGTTANNTAIFGTVRANKRFGKRIVTTAIEHPSVNECMKRLEEEGYEVIRLFPDKNGSISQKDLFSAITKDTILVSIMLVNNEIGVINPVQLVKTAINQVNSPAYLHVDAVQGFGKIPIRPEKMGIDLLTVSSHKVHGPKGAGALYIKKGIKIKPYVLGGGQEKGIYSGTEAMPAIVGFGSAVAELPNLTSQIEKTREIRDYFINEVSKIGGIHINSPCDSLPYIINLSIEGLPSQTIVNCLSEEGIYISAGSACKKGHESEVLKAIGLSSNLINSAVRISLSRFTTKEDMYQTVCAIKRAVQRIRR